MSKHFDADPGNVHKHARKLEPGATLALGKGRYRNPIVIEGVSGTKQDPVLICGRKAKEGPGLDYDAYRRQANVLSAVQEAGGEFPGVYHVADNAALILRNCQWVIVRDLCFDGCWPTAVYIDNCQHVTLRRLSIRGSTIAIGATGYDTRHLLIEDCDWVQDTSSTGAADIERLRASQPLPAGGDYLKKSRLWKLTNWLQLHGDREVTRTPVDIDNDARAFDGDFFRGWTIPGYVIIRNNFIMDAFNGVHLLNQAPASIVKKFSRNVMIENNWFVRIRDNCVEPAHFAWNWTVRHNRFVDCHMPFSFEQERSGFFYIYGNLGWTYHRPGPAKDIPGGAKKDERNTGQLFKLASRHKADGPHYAMHNSWLLRGPIAKKKRLASFFHLNNAIGYYTDGEDYDEAKGSPFGPGWAIPYDPCLPEEDNIEIDKKRFTKAWDKLDIRFDGDVIGHPDYPDRLRSAGYPVNGWGDAPEFTNRDLADCDGFKWPGARKAASVTVSLPNGKQTQTEIADPVVGAWQGDTLFSMPDPLFVEYWEDPDDPDDRCGKRCCKG